MTGASALYSQISSSLPDTSYYVNITDPSIDGYRVGREYDVKGTAHIQAGQYLWVLCHRRGLPLWWPQSDASIDPVTNQWIVTVAFGEAEDIGRDFEIMTIIVNRQGGSFLGANIGKAVSRTLLPDYHYSALRIVNKVSH